MNESLSAARQAAAAVARIDALGFELERIAQATNAETAHPPRELLSWLDRALAELAFQIRALERAVALRSLEGGGKQLSPDPDGGLAARIAALRPDDVARGVAGFYSDYFRSVGLSDEHRFIADPFRDTRAIPGLFSRKLGEVYAGLEPVRATFDVMGELAATEGAGAAARLDALLAYAARRVRYRLATNVARCSELTRRLLEQLRAADEAPPSEAT